ncbi:MAG: S9 family peptidase [Ardenticatenaceae bacterium]
MSKFTAPYGAWRSPLSAELLAKSGVRLSFLQVSGEDVYWVEGRPLEKGRSVIVRRSPDGTVADVTPAEFNARTLVHEYGGGMYVVDGEVVYFSNFADQRLYRQRIGGQAPQPITPEPPAARSVRYADGRVTPDGGHLICVRERHEEGGEVINELVAVPELVEGQEAGGDPSGEPRVIASGYDFYSTPRISPDGTQLAWLCWQNPQMPWDGTELWVGRLGEGASVSEARQVAGSGATQASRGESIFQPEWSPEGVLHFISDRSNWWNLYREVDGEIEALAPMAAEFGQPQWAFGFSRYVFLPDGRIACVYSQNGIDYLGLITPGIPEVEPIACDYTSLHWLSSDGERLWLIGGSPTSGTTLFSLDLADGSVTPIKRSMKVDIDPAHFSPPRSIEFPTENGLTAHAIYYSPKNTLYQAPADERPPLLVISHGGPTSATRAQLLLSIQYWTTRGFAVVDVNYGGSTGYGREYRERLNGSWGIVDVMDCINAARYLIEQGKVDGTRIAVRGGSAGGYTTLRALTWQDFFAAGASYFGVADLGALAEHTHKFEARYLDTLIGPYPEQKALYDERSPVNDTEQLNCPIILFQGLEDKVVPPAQAEAMVEALEAKGLPYAYLPFEGEQHGFRQAENIIRCAEAELYFYSRVFGFDVADEIDPVEIANL